MRVASEAMSAAAEVMDNPTDLINVAIEELVRQRIKLPTFSTLDRLSRRIRALVNGSFFAAVMERLSEAERGQLDALLEVGDSPQKKNLFFTLKQLPKRSSMEHLQDLLNNIVKLSETINADHHLIGIPYVKIKHFAAEAKALDAAELKKFSPPKRYVLVLSMIHRARVQARDDLADIFIKRMNHIHQRGKKDELERLRITHIGGRYFDRMHETKSSPGSYDEGVRRQVWDAIIALTNRHRHRVKLDAPQESVAVLCFIVHEKTVENYGHTGGTSCSANEQKRIF